MIDNRFDRRRVLQLGAGAASALAITPQAIAQAPKGGPLKTLNIASIAGLTSSTLIDLAARRGYFEKYGIEPKWVEISDGVKILSAIVSGDLDIVRAAGFGATLTAIEKGATLKVIGGGGLLIAQAVYSGKPDIKTLKDLEGRVVGTGQVNALLHHMMMALLRKHNVDVNKVKFVNVGSSTDVLRAVSAGTVDAGPGPIDVYGEMDKFKIHAIADFWSELPEYPYQAAFTADKTIAERRDTLVRGLAALAELYRYLQSPESHDDYLAAYSKATNGKGDSTAEYQWKFFQKYKPYGLIIPEENVNYLQELNLEAGIQEKKLPLDKILDLSMARDALKMIG